MNLTYVFGRLCSLLLRPLAIYLITTFSTKQDAVIIAKVYLIVPIVVLLLANDAHRSFYKRKFSESETKIVRAFDNYFFAIILLCLLGIFMLGLYFLFDNFSSNLFIPVVLYFLSEKVGDEVLRFKLFEKKFTDWGKLAISKFLLQTITLCICIYFDASGNLAFIFFAISGIGTCLIFHEAFKFFTKKRVLFFLRINGGQVKNSFFLIIRNWHIWLFSLLGALVGYLDRIVMMTADAGGLPFFSILVFCMSSIQMGVDFFYITTRRKDFLVGSIEFFKTIRSAKFLQVLAGTIVLACAATIMAFYTLKNYSNISFFIVFLILSNQICLAVNSLAREIIYWTHKIRQALFADIIFWILITVLVILGKILHLSIPVLLSISSACILLRVLAYIYISISIKASASFIPNDKQ